MVAGESLDPLGVSPTAVIPAMTPMGPVPATGKYKPIRRTLADGGCTTGQSSVPVTDTTMFAAGDVIVVKAQATPLTAAAAVGTIASIVAGVSLEMTGNASNAVVSGDIVEVAENCMVEDIVILEATLDLRGPLGTAVDRGSVGVIDGQLFKSALNFNTAKGISITRLEHEIPQVTFLNAVAGVVD